MTLSKEKIHNLFMMIIILIDLPICNLLFFMGEGKTELLKERISLRKQYFQKTKKI